MEAKQVCMSRQRQGITNIYMWSSKFYSLAFTGSGRFYYNVTHRPIARELVGKRVSVEMNFWKPIRHGEMFPYVWDTGDQETFSWIRKEKMFSVGESRRYIRDN
jgi:hypothetical protein